MRQVLFEKRWESKLISGEKIAFIVRGNPFISQIEFSVKLTEGKYQKGKPYKSIGYSKVTRVKNIKGKDLYNFTLKDVTKFRSWITIANQYGYKKAQDFVQAMIDKYNPDEEEDLQIVFFLPVRKKPYGVDL
jgi:hypothetical protein